MQAINHWELTAGTKRIVIANNEAVEGNLVKSALENRNRNNGKLNSEEISEIYRMLNEGMYCRDIIHKSGINRDTMTKYKKIWVKSGGVYVGLRSTTTKKDESLDKNRILRKKRAYTIIKFLDLGLKTNEITALLNINRKAVYRAKKIWIQKLIKNPIFMVIFIYLMYY